MFDAGADVFRLNFSHGTKDDHRNRVDTIRAVEREKGRPIGILLDLQGPKLRVGKIAGGEVRLTEGAGFRLDMTDKPGDVSRAPLLHPEVFEALNPGMDLLLDDGKIRLRVRETGDDFAVAEVINGGLLSDHKGVNVPSAVLNLSAMTDKDREDLAFGLELGVDWVALSFVQRPDDIIEAKGLIGGRAMIMAKLEKPAAIDHLARIIEESDAVMVARGDLGVEVAPEDVPTLQKRIIFAGREAGKPVVVATQMLDSMVHAPTPTRAEASDVATAIYDGADAVMLSAETAVGDFPIEAVTIMDRIIRRVEKDEHIGRMTEAQRRAPTATEADAITAAARNVAQTIGAACIVTFSATGSTTLRCARERPSVPILGLTPRAETAGRLTLAWGVHSVHTEDLHSFAEMVIKASAIATREEFAKSGDTIVITAGVPFGTPGQTNILRIARIK